MTPLGEALIELIGRTIVVQNGSSTDFDSMEKVADKVELEIKRLINAEEIERAEQYMEKWYGREGVPVHLGGAIAHVIKALKA